MAKDTIREQMRKNTKKNLPFKISSCDIPVVARHVDAKPYNQAVTKLWRNWENSAKKHLSNESAEKARESYTTGFRTSEIPLYMNFERDYYERFGQGLDGSSRPTPRNKNYICRKCGLKMWMATVTLPMKCPRCGAPTPLGEWVEQGYYKR